MVTRAGLRSTRDYLTPGICSLIKPVAMENWCHFAPKPTRSCYNVNQVMFFPKFSAQPLPELMLIHHPWWRHQMETFSALLAICAGNYSPVTGAFLAQRPVTRSFNAFFDMRLNKPLSTQWWGWWFETLSRQLLRHCNEWVFKNTSQWNVSRNSVNFH